MPTTTIAGVEVAVNEEGFLEQPDQWNKDMAVEIVSWRVTAVGPPIDRQRDADLKLPRNETHHFLKAKRADSQLGFLRCLLYELVDSLVRQRKKDLGNPR